MTWKVQVRNWRIATWIAMATTIMLCASVLSSGGDFVRRVRELEALDRRVKLIREDLDVVSFRMDILEDEEVRNHIHSQGEIKYIE